MKWYIWAVIGIVNFIMLAMGGMLQIGAVVLFAICVITLACTKH